MLEHDTNVVLLPDPELRQRWVERCVATLEPETDAMLVATAAVVQRLRDGVDAASFGVATLLTNMALPAAP